MRIPWTPVWRVVAALVVPALLTACAGSSQSSQVPLENRFEATTDHPYSFRYPAAWVVGDETVDGDLAIGIEGAVGMVLEPVHPWGGEGAFAGRGARPVEVDGYDAYRLELEGDPTTGRGLAYRIDAEGIDVTLWFFADEPRAYDGDLFDAIMDTFRIEEDLLSG